MALRYEEFGGLQDGHAVTAIAFSPQGSYIATAGVDDCTVCVWRVLDQKRLFTVKTSTAVLSIHWLPQREDIFVIGHQGGVISTVRVEQETLAVKGFWAHRHPIEHLKANPFLLASGAKSEVTIWSAPDRYTVWNRVRELSTPSTSSLNEDCETLVTSLHWFRAQGQLLLLVTYMYHGISIFNADDWSIVRNIPLPGVIAHSSMSPDGGTIAISNMLSGFDLYDMTSLAVLRSFTHPVDVLRAVPVMFVHGGHALLGGSTCGMMHLWNVHNGRLHQKFSLGPSRNVMAIDANYNAAADRFLLAAGVCDKGTSTSVVIWMARDIGRRPTTTGGSIPWTSISIAIVVAIGGVALCSWYSDATRDILLEIHKHFGSLL
ncbi:WD40 repeat-like protein [Trametes coccinea BRFM310]|uniref:WD40 repeat-like protein n=1 Tax=Trametes coccinea (strain BRFM310) TaxID=1353009 RepID=A0A1Y2IPG8_TRAC3|nr:WD40 repeat-like protein [Trametes coccinea BRFM310]